MLGVADRWMGHGVSCGGEDPSESSRVGTPGAGFKALSHTSGFFLTRAKTTPTVELTQQSSQQAGASGRTQLPRGPCDVQLSSHGPWPLPCGQIQESGGSGVFPDRTVVWAALGGTWGRGPLADGGRGVTGPPQAARISEPLHWQPPHPAPLLCPRDGGDSAAGHVTPPAPWADGGRGLHEAPPTGPGKALLVLGHHEQQPRCPH